MIDATLSSFERDVIEASMEVPVLVSFWAPWCAPCKVLSPLLERLEHGYGGRFKLVNVNSDTNPELTTSFNLRTIPYAVVFIDGNAIAQFMGSQPEAFVRAFLDRLIPDPAEMEHTSARDAIARGQLAIAEDFLKNAIAMDPARDGARLDMVSVLLARGELDRARAHFDLLGSKAQQQSTYESVRSRLHTAERAAYLPPAEFLGRRIRLDPHGL